MSKSVSQEISGDEKREFLDALANGLRLLEAFDERTRTVSIQSAAELLDVTRAASRRILITLTQMGYLNQNDRLFELAPRSLELGYRYFRSLGLPAAARPHLLALSRELNAGAAIGILSGTDVLFVERVEAERPIKLDLRAGDRLPAYAHSLGRALLAQLPAERLAEHLPTGAMAKLSRHTVIERKALSNELAQVRQRGWSFTDSELVAGLFGVAIPLTSSSGETNVGLNVSSIGEPWSLSHIETHIVPSLRACAARIRALTDALC